MKRHNAFTGTYYVVPYTTGCKFTIAGLDDREHDKLFTGSQPTPKCGTAIREIHDRYDVDLDRLLTFQEFATLVHEIAGHELVQTHLEYLCSISPAVSDRGRVPDHSAAQ